MNTGNLGNTSGSLIQNYYDKNKSDISKSIAETKAQNASTNSMIASGMSTAVPLIQKGIFKEEGNTLGNGLISAAPTAFAINPFLGAGVLAAGLATNFIGGHANKERVNQNKMAVAQAKADIDRTDLDSVGAASNNFVNVGSKSDYGTGILGRRAYKKAMGRSNDANITLANNIDAAREAVENNMYRDSILSNNITAFGGPLGGYFAYPMYELPRRYAEGGEMGDEEMSTRDRMMQQVQSQMAGENPMEGMPESMPEGENPEGMEEPQEEVPQEEPTEESEEPEYEEGKVYDISKEEYERLIDEGYEIKVLKK